VQTTFPRLMLDHAKQRPDAPALREKVYGIWQTTTWAELAQLVRSLACGWPPPACSAATMWWWWAKTGRGCTPPCWPRSRWAPCRCRCTRMRRPPEYAFPINNAEVGFAIVEDQEQVDKLLELREQCPQPEAHLVRRPARPAQLRRAGAGFSLDA
jgi:long-chain acyl-CoA synthetase